jgi:hypothetical protein
MTAVIGILREIAGLFVDDGRLALSILAVVAVAVVLSRVPGAGLAAGSVLLFGCLAVLLANVVRTVRR